MWPALIGLAQDRDVISVWVKIQFKKSFFKSEM